MIISPCAMLMTPMTPKVMARPVHTARPALRRRDRDLMPCLSLSSPRSIVRQNISFPAPRPFHPSACTRRQRITHQPSTGPSSTPVAASPQSSAAFSPQQFLAKPSPSNAAAEPNPHRRPTAYRLPAGSFFGGFRTPASSLRVDGSCQAGIRNPSQNRSFTSAGALGMLTAGRRPGREAFLGSACPSPRSPRR